LSDFEALRPVDCKIAFNIPNETIVSRDQFKGNFESYPYPSTDYLHNYTKAAFMRFKEERVNYKLCRKPTFKTNETYEETKKSLIP
jgi:hypothetical protein